MEYLVTAWLWERQLTYVYIVTLTVAIKDRVRKPVLKTTEVLM